MSMKTFKFFVPSDNPDNLDNEYTIMDTEENITALEDYIKFVKVRQREAILHTINLALRRFQSEL